MLNLKKKCLHFNIKQIHANYVQISYIMVIMLTAIHKLKVGDHRLEWMAWGGGGRLGGHVQENGSDNWKLSFFGDFCHFRQIWGSPVVRQGPKCNFPKACTLWWSFNPNKVHYSGKWKVKGPQKGYSQEKMRFFAIFGYRLA